jgi:hypothetical protein
MARVGLPCRHPMEAFPSRRKYVRVHDLLHSDVYLEFLAEAWPGCYSYIYFGIPCSTWSLLARIISNSEAVLRLARTCPGVSAKHQHVHALGTRKENGPHGPRSVSVAFSAGRYPSALCEAPAQLIMATTDPATTPVRPRQ